MHLPIGRTFGSFCGLVVISSINGLKSVDVKLVEATPLFVGLHFAGGKRPKN
jgi:hypothetical protein